MALTHVQFLEVFPFHEPFPLIPSFSPSGGEGARRAVEGDSDRFMASIHVRILEVSPSHEPPLSRPSATLSPPCGERAGRGVPIWFMVPMRAQKRKETSHELLRVVDPRSGERLCEAQRFMAPMNRTPSPHPSPPIGERVPEGRVRGVTSSRAPL